MARLSADEQRQLLATGSAVERLWAAWALGLRVGAAAVPDLQTAAAAAPIPGLRAHLVIVLAGLGERQLVEAFALHDPDVLVRVAAGEHLLHTLPAETSPLHEPALDSLLRDPSADVRLAVLRELLRLLAQRGLSPPSVADLARLAHDPEPAVRRLALETLVGLPADESILETLERRLAVEPESKLRCWLAARLIAAGRESTVLALVSGDDSEHDRDLLRALQDAGQRFDWDQIAALVRLGRPSLDANLMALLVPVDSRALAWLLACALRAEQWFFAANGAAEAYLDHLLPRLRADQLTEAERAQSRQLIAATERQLANEEQWIIDEYWECRDQPAAPHDPGVAAEVAEWRAGDWYQQNIRRIEELRRLVGASE